MGRRRHQEYAFQKNPGLFFPSPLLEGVALGGPGSVSVSSRCRHARSQGRRLIVLSSKRWWSTFRTADAAQKLSRVDVFAAHGLRATHRRLSRFLSCRCRPAGCSAAAGRVSRARPMPCGEQRRPDRAPPAGGAGHQICGWRCLQPCLQEALQGAAAGKKPASALLFGGSAEKIRATNDVHPPCANTHAAAVFGGAHAVGANPFAAAIDRIQCAARSKLRIICWLIPMPRLRGRL